MEKFNYKREIIFWILLLIPIVYLASVWNELPATVPINFRADGEPNGWGSKASEFILIGVSIFAYVFLLFIKKIDSKIKGESFFTSNFYKLKLALFFFLSVMGVMVIHAGLPGARAAMGSWIPASGFLFIAVLGNFMINLKPSWFIGFRTPWTLSSDTVWRKTHQVGGRIWFYGGLICAMLTFVLKGALLQTLLLTFILASVVFDFGYSFWLFKQEQKEASE